MIEIAGGILLAWAVVNLFRFVTVHGGQLPGLLWSIVIRPKMLRLFRSEILRGAALFFGLFVVWWYLDIQEFDR